MLNKKDFIRAINLIEINDNKINKLNEVNRDASLFVIDYCLKDEMIELLETAMEIIPDENYGSIISWYIYDNNYGKENLKVYINNKNGKNIKYVINTPEKLYNYILKCKENKENK